MIISTGGSTARFVRGRRGRPLLHRSTSRVSTGRHRTGTTRRLGWISRPRQQRPRERRRTSPASLLLCAAPRGALRESSRTQAPDQDRQQLIGSRHRSMGPLAQESLPNPPAPRQRLDRPGLSVLHHSTAFSEWAHLKTVNRPHSSHHTMRPGPREQPGGNAFHDDVPNARCCANRGADRHDAMNVVDHKKSRAPIRHREVSVLAQCAALADRDELVHKIRSP